MFSLLTVGNLSLATSGYAVTISKLALVVPMSIDGSQDPKNQKDIAAFDEGVTPLDAVINFQSEKSTTASIEARILASFNSVSSQTFVSNMELTVRPREFPLVRGENKVVLKNIPVQHLFEQLEASRGRRTRNKNAVIRTVKIIVTVSLPGQMPLEIEKLISANAETSEN